MRFASSLVLIVTLATAACPAALAQEDDAYRDLVRRAVQEHSEGRYREARALFRRAHERFPNARTLRGIGMTNFELRQYAATIDALQAALAETRRPLTDAQRASAQDLIDRSRPFVARYTLEPAAAIDSVRVDGAPGVVTDGVLLVDLGTHEIAVRCEGCSRDPRSVRVAGGEEATLDFTAEPEPTPAPAADPLAEGGPEPEAPLRSESDGLDGVTVALFTTAAVAGAGAVGTGLWWRDRNSEIDVCDARRAECLNRDRLRTERNALVGVTLGLAVASAGLLTVGLLTLEVEDDDGEARLSCAPAGMGVACFGAF